MMTSSFLRHALLTAVDGKYINALNNKYGCRLFHGKWLRKGEMRNDYIYPLPPVHAIVYISVTASRGRDFTKQISY